MAAPTLPGCYTVGNGNSNASWCCPTSPEAPGNGSLVVRGQPEVGKSALLTDMVNRADHRTDPNRATPGEAGLASTVG